MLRDSRAEVIPFQSWLFVERNGWYSSLKSYEKKKKKRETVEAKGAVPHCLHKHIETEIKSSERQAVATKMNRFSCYFSSRSIIFI